MLLPLPRDRDHPQAALAETASLVLGVAAMTNMAGATRTHPRSVLLAENAAIREHGQLFHFTHSDPLARQSHGNRHMTALGKATGLGARRTATSRRPLMTVLIREKT